MLSWVKPASSSASLSPSYSATVPGKAERLEVPATLIGDLGAVPAGDLHVVASEEMKISLLLYQIVTSFMLVNSNAPV